MNQVVRGRDRGQAGMSATGSGSGSAGHMDSQGREIVRQLPRKGLSALAEASTQHWVDMLFQGHHLAIRICERKQGSCMLQRKVAKFAVVYNFMWGWWFHCFLVSQLIHPCQGQVQRPVPPVFPLSSILAVLRLDFWMPERWWAKAISNFSFTNLIKIFLYTACIEIQPCNLFREWAGLFPTISFLNAIVLYLHSSWIFWN